MRPIRLRALLFAAALAATSLGACSPPASAGAYSVELGCAAPDGWRYETNTPTEFEWGRVCPVTETATTPWGKPGSGAFTGTYARVRITPDAGMPGTDDRAVLRLSGPPTTMISELRLRHWLGMEGGSGWTLYGRTGEGVGIPEVSCSSPVDCDAGGPGTTARTLALNTAFVDLGFECFDPVGACTEGATIHHARVAVYFTQATLNDPQGPILDAEAGDLLNATPHAGTESAHLSATDATGIKEVRAYIDGHRLAVTPRSCDYTRMRPCTDATPTAVAVDTRSVTDGTHTLRLAAVDAAGNETLGPPHAIVVDNPDPPAPAPPVSRGAEPQSVTVPLPAEPDTSTPSDAAAVAPADPFPAPLPGVSAPAAPSQASSAPRPTNLRIARVGRVARGLALTGDSNLPTGTRVQVSHVARARGRTQRATRQASVRDGRWSTLLPLSRRMRDAAGTLTVRYAGDGRNLPALARKRVAEKR
jgi:hypothetical protein